MADARFFDRQGPFSLEQLAGFGEAELMRGDRSEQFHDVAALSEARPSEVSFLDNPSYAADLQTSRAGACVLAQKHVDKAPADMALLVSEAPYRSYALIASAFYPQAVPVPGVATSATVAESAVLGEGCEIGAGAVIGERAEIGANCIIAANAVIGRGVVLGNDCRIGVGSTLSHCLVGSRVTIHPGVRIGQDGFGFAADPRGHVKVPQVGRVVIGDDCEIGANTTIDRGSTRDTVVGDGCWIDNLVQIGHNVVLGRGCIVVAMAGVSGSTTVGNFVAIGGQAGIAGHLQVGDGAQIGAQSGVMSDVSPGARIVGSPAMDAREFFRQQATLRRLSKSKATKG